MAGFEPEESSGARDVTLICPMCRIEWTLTITEQQWFAERGLFQPRRCGACRAAKRRQVEGQ